MYQRILIATDGSEFSSRAVQSGFSLANLSGAQVVVLRVVAHYPQSYFEGVSTADFNEVKKIEHDWSAAAQKFIDDIKAQGVAQGLQVDGVVSHSDLIAETIIETAKDKQCDLIVMASHGRKGLSRLLLGSETQHVLTHTHIPVLVLR